MPFSSKQKLPLHRNKVFARDICLCQDVAKYVNEAQWLAIG